MAASLKGSTELRRRLKAIKAITKPAGVGGRRSAADEWAIQTAKIAKTMVPVRTGGTKRSIRAARRRGEAAVVGFYTVNFIDAGSKAHVEPRQPGLTPTGRVSRRKRGTGKRLKFMGQGGRTYFRKKVFKPAIAARPFKKEAGRRGVQVVRWGEIVTALWNKAA